jgi:hypothetical protein
MVEFMGKGQKRIVLCFLFFVLCLLFVVIVGICGLLFLLG